MNAPNPQPHMDGQILQAVIQDQQLIPAQAMTLLLDRSFQNLLTEATSGVHPAIPGCHIPGEFHTLGVSPSHVQYAPLYFRFIRPNPDLTVDQLRRAIEQIGRLPTVWEGKRVLEYFRGRLPTDGTSIRCIHHADEGGLKSAMHSSGVSSIPSDHVLGESRGNRCYLVIIDD